MRTVFRTGRSAWSAPVDAGRSGRYGRPEAAYAMEFRLLGPLEVVERDRALSLGAGKQRALLAILLLNANEVVSTDRLQDELWGETPPETAGKALQVHVSQLRKVLEPERGSGDPGR